MSSHRENVQSGEWQIKKDLTLQDGRLVVWRLTIQPREGTVVPPGGITARLLRHVKISGDYGIKVVFTSRKRTAKRRQRGKRADDAFYAELARDYVTTWAQGRETKPTAILAAARGTSLEHMRSQIHLARRNGFLTETTRGRSGGELTDKSKRTLSSKAGKR